MVLIHKCNTCFGFKTAIVTANNLTGIFKCSVDKVSGMFSIAYNATVPETGAHTTSRARTHWLHLVAIKLHLFYDNPSLRQQQGAADVL